MNKPVATQAFVCAFFVLVSAKLLQAQGGYIHQMRATGSPQRAGLNETGSGGDTAVDIKGHRHSAREYPGYYAPWNSTDRVSAAAPQYPYEDQSAHNHGTGLFDIAIDPKSGAVIQVTILRSTGHASLDEAAIAALHRWRWKRDTWKEVDVSVTFQLTSRPITVPPPSAIGLRH
jgi:TonB family protein